MTWIFFLSLYFLPQEKETVVRSWSKNATMNDGCHFLSTLYKHFHFAFFFTDLLLHGERERLLDWMSFWSTLKAFKACKQSRSKSPLLLVTFQTIFGDLQTVCVSRMKVTKQSKDLWTIEIIDECEKDIRDSRHFPVNHERISSIPTIQNSISNSILWWRST